MREYSYVGPQSILERLRNSPSGVCILAAADLTHWLTMNAADQALDGTITATFVIDCSGCLRLAPRRSEHVACAGGARVLSAGEMTFASTGEVLDVSNQSTGYCPEPESWPAVSNALDHIGVRHPNAFTIPVVFRRCPKCRERTIVKDDWYVCELCGADLPMAWNL
jgi:hypothetical protein